MSLLTIFSLRFRRYADYCPPVISMLRLPYATLFRHAFDWYDAAAATYDAHARLAAIAYAASCHADGYAADAAA